MELYRCLYAAVEVTRTMSLLTMYPMCYEPSTIASKDMPAYVPERHSSKHPALY